jgi:glycosyltransferase involved in cell wall biosynthesis
VHGGLSDNFDARMGSSARHSGVTLQDPEVTVVITTRDRAALVKGAIESALAQTLQAVEVVVVDDASAEPLRIGRVDERLRVLRRTSSSGVCAARNAGLAAARGRWVTFLDDDDELLPDMLESSLRAAQASTLPRPVAVLAGIEEIDRDGHRARVLLPVSSSKGGHYALDRTGHGDFATYNTLVCPTEMMLAIGGWDEALRAWEHTDLFLRLNQVCSIQGVERVLYRRRDHRTGRLSANLPARADSLQRTLIKHRAAFAQHPERHAYYLGAMGITWLRLGRWRPAMAATTRSLCLAPRRPKGVAQWLASLTGPRIWGLLDPARRRLQPPRPRAQGRS